MNLNRLFNSLFNWLLLALFALLVLSGCKSAEPVAQVDYARPLPPGAHALRKLEPGEWPDMSAAIGTADATLVEALDRSLAWFAVGSSQRFFPMQGVTHEQARASAFALRQILTESNSSAARPDGAAVAAAIARDFDMYTSVGWDGSGAVLFTGYYAPVFRASKVKAGEYQYPLYTRPADLVSDSATGKVLGRQGADGAIAPYPTRAQIEAYPDRLGLVGRELVWLKSKLDAYIVQVNGSARLRMTDGSIMHVGYSATNGLEYTSIGKLLVADGKIAKDRISLPAIKDYFAKHPQDVDYYTIQNDRYVFFQSYGGDDWPAGSLGVRITAMRSIATDKSIFPRGCVTLVATQVPNTEPGGGRYRTFEQFMVDQDTGGAIRSAGRADLYMGVGARAGWMAGRQIAEGRLYYLLLKPQSVAGWAARMSGTATAAAGAPAAAAGAAANVE